MNKVDIVIPVHNNFELTKRCIESVLDTVTSNESRIGQLIIVDDCSTEGNLKEHLSNDDGSFFYPPAEIGAPYINFVTTPHRMHYSGAVNYGFHFVTSKYAMLLTNDTKIFTREWVKIMMNEFESNENVGLLAPCPVGYYNPEPVDNSGFDCSSIGGYAWLMESDYYRQIGGLREDGKYVHWHSDIELCERIRANNKKIGISSAYVQHGGGWSNKFVPDYIPRG